MYVCILSVCFRILLQKGKHLVYGINTNVGGIMLFKVGSQYS